MKVNRIIYIAQKFGSLIVLNFLDVSSVFLFFFIVVLLFVLIRCNDKATVSVRMSLVCLAHKLHHCTVSCVL